MKLVYDCTKPSYEKFEGSDIDYRTTSCTFLRAAKFGQMQSEFLKEYSKLTSELQWIGSVLLFEAIVNEDDLLEISKTGSVFKSNGTTTLLWTTSDDRTDSRSLSCISSISYSRLGSQPWPTGDMGEQIKTLLQHIAPDLPRQVDHRKYISLCAAAWCFTKLPMFLFAHVVGDSCMSALPRAVLARRDSKLALATYFTQVQEEVAEDTALEGYFHAELAAERPETLNKLLDQLTSENPHNLTERQLQIEMAKRLRTLATLAENSGPISCLILSHCIQMFASGGHALSSQIAYVKNGAPAVLRALSGKNLEELTSADFASSYTSGLSKLSGENLRKARAYIGHFHAYIREWIDVSPLRKAALPGVEPSRIDPNVVWPHERKILQRRIGEQAKHDERLAEQASIVVDLIAACFARGKEVFMLQVRNVRVSADVVEIEIVTWGRALGLKTDAAQRVIKLRDEVLASKVLAWKNMRLNEGAKGSSLLFGSRDEQNRCYRLGLMYPWLNLALKCSSGDPNSSLHHMRHGASDEYFSGLSLDEKFHEEIDQLCVKMGHASLSSTRKYLHSYPKFIRLCLDGSLAKVSISSAITSKLISEKSTTIRKRIERNRHVLDTDTSPANAASAEFSLNSAYWMQIESYSNAQEVERSEVGIPLCCPVSCNPMVARRAFNVIDIAWVLRDIQDGYTPAQAARQRMVDEAFVEGCCNEIVRLGNAALRSKRESRIRLSDTRAALLALSIDMSRAWQGKYKGWLVQLASRGIPVCADTVWEAYEDSKWGTYIEISHNLGAHLWLGFLSSLSFPTCKMVIKQEDLTEKEKDDLEACVVLGIGQGAPLAPTLMPRSVRVKFNPERPKVYLHIANEDEVVTDHTGAAFETGGLEALMLTLRAASVAAHG